MVFITPGLGWGLVWTVARFFVDYVLTDNLSFYAIKGTWGVSKEAIVTEEELTRVRKFRESFWRFCIYGTDCALGVYISFFKDGQPKPWVTDRMEMIDGWPNEHVPTPDLELIYAVGFGLYLHELLGVFMTVRMKDFYVMLAHHVITLTLCVLTWMNRWFRGGSLIFLLHDFSDIFLEGAKCFNYAKDKHHFAKFGADIMFAIFAASFFYLRLYVYLTHFVWLGITQGCAYCSCEPEPYPGGWGCGFKFYAMIGSFLSLTVLQLIWGVAILRVLYNILVLGHEGGDVREEDYQGVERKGAKKQN